MVEPSETAPRNPDAETEALLRRAVALLEAIAIRLTPLEPSRQLTKAEVARRLGVSTRWVERHLTPVAQPARRGRSWYAIEDIDRQLASWRREPAARPARAKSRRAVSERGGVHDERAREIEADLRADLARRR